MKKLFIVSILSLVILYKAANAAEIKWRKISHNKYDLYVNSEKSYNVNETEKYLENGILTVEKYFNKIFPQKFDVYLFPSRAELDKQWSNDWGVPDFKSECWMVASGVARRLDLLSTDCWKNEACEHDAEDKNHIGKIVTHELVHVFHGQNNPVPDFNGMDNLGWFIEGLAVLVSGQLDSAKVSDLKRAKEEKMLPGKLKNAWNGKYRYSISGSMVKFIEEKYGPATILRLLNLTGQEEILGLLKITEEEFLSSWKTSF